MGTLRKGSCGAEVRALQHALNARPYLHLKEDGIYGTQTENAVREFQRRVRLSTDGIYGPKTDALLWARVIQADVVHTVPLAGPANSAATPNNPVRQNIAPAIAAGPTPPPSSGAGVVHQVSVGGQVALTPWLVRPVVPPGTPTGPIWSGLVSYALVYRTASQGPHVELALNPQILVNSRVQSSDPRWGMQLNGQVTFADLVAPGRFHLISPYLQATAAGAFGPGSSFGGGFAIGNQISFDLIPDRLQINLQGNVGAQWSRIGTPDASFSVVGQGAIGTTVQF
jgi:peptidoglycan hydrolase-like protein with peptidoglycan-binding domain